MVSKRALKRYLKEHFQYKHERKQSLEAWLVRHVCSDSGYSPEDRLKDIATHGCVSGCVGELIYYSDVVRFYQKYESQIWELVCDFLQSTGYTLGQFIDNFRQTIEDEVRLKNYLAWFAVEQLAFKFLEQFNVAY